MTIKMYADRHIKEGLNNGIIPKTDIIDLIHMFPIFKNGVGMTTENNIKYELYEGGAGWRLVKNADF